MSSSTLEIAKSVNDRLLEMAKSMQISKNALIQLAAAALVSRYQTKRQFILVDLIPVKKDPDELTTKFTISLTDQVETGLNEIKEDIPYLSKNSLIEMAANTLATNFETSKHTIFEDLLNPVHAEKKTRKERTS